MIEEIFLRSACLVNEKDLLDYFISFAPLAVGVITIIIMCIANCISKRGIKQQNKQFLIQLRQEQRNLNRQLELQRKQWLYDVYVKRECEVLIKFRDMIHQAENSFFWFSSFLRPYKIMMKMFPEQDVKLKEDNLIVKYDDYKKHYNILNEINNFYNSNQIIIEKAGIKEEFIYIIAVLNTCVWLDEKSDFKYFLVEENDKFIKYKMNNIEKVGKPFVSYINFEKDKDPNNLIIDYNEKDLDKYSNNLPSICFDLLRKLDKLMFCYDNNIPKNWGLKQSKFPNL